MHQQAHGGARLHCWAPGAQAVLGNHPATGATFGTRTPVEKRPDGARQALGTQAGDGVAHREHREQRSIDTEKTRTRLSGRSLPAIRLAVVASGPL